MNTVSENYTSAMNTTLILGTKQNEIVVFEHASYNLTIPRTSTPVIFITALFNIAKPYLLTL